MISNIVTWIIGIAGAFIVGIFVLPLITSLFLMLGWNYVMPYLFHVPEISWLQAYALSVVSAVLFNRSRGSKEES